MIKKAYIRSEWDVQAFLNSENQRFSDCLFFNKQGGKK